MDNVKIVLVICIWVLFPLLVGSLYGTVLKAGKEERTPKEIYLYGCLVYGALLGMLSFVCRCADFSFERSQKLVLLMSAVLLGVCLAAMALSGKYRLCVKSLFAQCLRKPEKTDVYMIVAFLLVACIYVIRPFAMEIGYDTPERVVTMLDGGLMSGLNIWTGESAVTGVKWTEYTDYLPLFYACLCRWTGLAPAAVLFDAAPFVVLLQAFCVIALWTEQFLGKDGKCKGISLLLFALLTICGNAAYMNTSYGLLWYPYEAVTVFSSILLPLAVWCVFLRKSVMVTVLAVFNALCLGGVVRGGIILALALICLAAAKLIGRLAERRETRWM